MRTHPVARKQPHTLELSTRLWPKSTNPDPTPADMPEHFSSCTRSQLEWLAKRGAYGQRLIANRYLRDWEKDHQ